MEIFFIIYCVAQKIIGSIQTRKAIIYIEVLNANEKMKRFKSKQNLNTVVETFQKKRNYALFDKFWYLKRAEAYDALPYQGFNID